MSENTTKNTATIEDTNEYIDENGIRRFKMKYTKKEAIDKSGQGTIKNVSERKKHRADSHQNKR